MAGPGKAFGRLWVLVGAVLLAGVPGSAHAQSTPIDGGSYWTWTNIDQGTCMIRALAAMQAAVGRFQIPAGVANDHGWAVGLTGLPDTHAGIHCIPDDDSPNLVAPGARRVLIVITAHTTRGFGSKAFRDFAGECMQTGNCPQVATAPIVGDWVNPGGWGNVRVDATADPEKFTGTYSAACAGSGTFELTRISTLEGDRYAGDWRDGRCKGRFRNVHVQRDGNVSLITDCLEGCHGTGLFHAWFRPPR